MSIHYCGEIAPFTMGFDIRYIAYPNLIERFGVFPVLLERDFNLPQIEELMAEVELIARKQRDHGLQRKIRA